jgi:hypothetical protein
MRIEVTTGATLVALWIAFGSRVAAAQLLPPPAPTAQPTSPAQPPGVLPPAPGEVPPQDAATYRQLEQAEHEDSGRGLSFLWIAPDVGFEFASLDALSNSDLVDDQVGSGSGLAFGGTAGVRWLFYTLGARFRYAPSSEFTLWSLGGDAGLRIPLGSFEPYVLLGGSYVSLGGFAVDDALSMAGATSDVAASGFSIRLGGGFDYYLTPVFSAGISVDGESLFLSRDAVTGGTNTIYDSSGSAVGLAVSSMAVLALHF